MLNLYMEVSKNFLAFIAFLLLIISIISTIAAVTKTQTTITNPGTTSTGEVKLTIIPKGTSTGMVTLKILPPLEEEGKNKGGEVK